MSYNKRIWTDRNVEFPNRRKLTPTGEQNIYAVTRDEGLIYDPGVPFNAETMNDLEHRISDAFDELGSANVSILPPQTRILDRTGNAAKTTFYLSSSNADAFEGTAITIKAGEEPPISPHDGQFFDAGANNMQDVTGLTAGQMYTARTWAYNGDKHAQNDINYAVHTFESGKSSAVTWTAITPPGATVDMAGVVYGNEFIAFGKSVVGFLRSTDGDNWTQISSVANPNVNWRSAAYGNGIYVAVTGGGVYMPIAYSKNGGVVWGTQYSTNIDSGMKNLSSVAFGNGVFVIGDGAGSETGSFLVGTDGVKWEIYGPPKIPVKTICFGDGLFVAVSESLESVYTSADGISWESHHVSKFHGLTINGIFYANNKYFVLANGKILISLNALEWEETQIYGGAVADFRALTYINDLYVVAAHGESMYASVTGLSWYTEALPESGLWSGICANGSKMIMCASGGTYARILKSP